MKRVINKNIFLSLALINVSLSSCSIPANTDSSILSPISVNNSPATKSSFPAHIFKVSEQKGAVLSFSINTPLNVKGFNLKATTNGKASKKANDVKSYMVYLIKNSSASVYPDNGDPLGEIVKTDKFNTDGETSSVVTFTNVPSSGSDSYYIAVRAFDGLDGSGTELIKANDGHNTAWGSTTQGISNRVSVSTGTGVSVSNTYQVSKTARLMITPNLEDAVGSVVQGEISLINGDATTVKSYKINLATDNTKPEITKLLANDLVINRSSTDLTNNNTHTINLSNIAPGTYYLTVKAYDNTGGNGNQLGLAGTAGTKIAVSTNKVTINNDQIVTFDPTTDNSFKVDFDVTTVTFIGEFKANTATAGIQRNSSVAMDSDGDFVVTWESSDGNGYGIYGQRYDSSGGLKGTEFKVNTYTGDNQQNPSVAMDSDGDFVVTWQSNLQDGSGYGIYGQRYDSSGGLKGTEFKVNTYTSDGQVNSSVAMDSDGDFVVTWQSYYQDVYGYGIYAQRYDSSGGLKGTEFKVNTYTTGNQVNPSVAMDSDGDFVVTWQSPDGNGNGIYGQRYDKAGATQGNEFKVNTYTTSDQANPSVAMDSDGDFVVTWQSYDQDGDGYGIYAQRYDKAGATQGNEFKVNTYTSDGQVNSSVAMDSDGDFVVTWQSQSQDGDGYGIYAQRYNKAGGLKGTEFKVNTYTSSNQRNPSVAMDSDGDFVVTWQSNYQDGSENGIYGQRYDSTGTEK